MVTMDSDPPPCSHPLLSQKHTWFTTENPLRALLYTRNWQRPNARRRHRKGNLPLGFATNCQSSEVLATWDFEKCFLICKWKEEDHWGYFASIWKVSWIPASQNTTKAIKTHTKNQHLKGKLDKFYHNF